MSWTAVSRSRSLPYAAGRRQQTQGAVVRDLCVPWYNRDGGRGMMNQALETLKANRIHVAPRALELSPQAAQRRFAAVWAPLEELVQRLRPVPPGLVRFWLERPSGHVVITHSPSRYQPGSQLLKRHVLDNVAFVSVADLAREGLEALVPVGHLLDHLLGNGGDAGGPWLSEGGGCTDGLRAVGGRVAELFPLGHALDAAAGASPRAYWARSVAQYLSNRNALNLADPLMERLLRSTVFAGAFWRPAGASSRQP